MAQTIDVGGTSSDESAAPEFVSVYIQPGGTGTVVTNNAGDTVNYYTSWDSAATGTIAVSASQTFTTGPVWITSNSISSVTLSGPGY